MCTNTYNIIATLQIAVLFHQIFPVYILEHMYIEVYLQKYVCLNSIVLKSFSYVIPHNAITTGLADIVACDTDKFCGIRFLVLHKKYVHTCFQNSEFQ